ncbi:DUF1819 family protein [Thiolapillus sp.]|uniref:DUF1819 family protein n=3 Tax=Thiolapillus sp. TaxID=2017437 RepID=UPI003AF5ADDD
MNSPRYRMSFSTGGLFLQESVLLATLYGEKKDWDQVRTEVIDNNLLQSRTVSTTKRIVREVIGRLQELDDQERQLLVQGNTEEQSSLLWLAICRRYPFIAEFSQEVLREHAMTYHNEISADDFDAFFNAKMEIYPELEKITDSTRKKQRQVLFRIMREAQIIDSNDTIIPASLTVRLRELLCSHQPQALVHFPLAEGCQ